jgi:hypothetical protein
MLRTTILFVALMATASPALALEAGPQLVWGDDQDLAIGGRIEFPTPELMTDTRIQGDFNWYFPDDSNNADFTFWEIDLNWLYQIGPAPAANDPDYYLGGGLNFAYASVDFDPGGDDSDTDLGVNFLGGVRVPLGSVRALAELRVTVAGSEQYTLGIGLLF